MTRLWIFLEKYATVEQNREMIREICANQIGLEDFKYFIEVYKTGFLARQIDKKIKLDRLLSNLERKNSVKFILGNLGEGHPNLLELFVGDIYIPNVPHFRTLDAYCPWTIENANKINSIFQRIYNKSILDFPIKR